MMRPLFRNLGLLTAAQIVARARGLILLPILSRYLGTAEYGLWAQVTVVVFALSPLVALGTENGIIRLLPGLDGDEQRRRFTAWFIYCIASAAIVAGAVAVSSGVLARAFFGPDEEFLRFVPLAAASLFAAMLLIAARQWFVIRNDGAVMSGIVVAQAVLGLVAVLAAVALGGGVFTMVAYGVAGDLAAALGVLALAVAGRAFARPDFAILGPALRYGLPLVPAGYALWGLNWIDRVFLVQYRSLAEIGIYAAAYSLGYAVVQLFTTPIWAIYPRTAAELHNRGDGPGLDRLVQGTVGAVLSIGAPAVAGLAMLGRPIIMLVAGPGYEAGAAVIPLITLAYLFSMLASFADVSLGLAYRQYFSTLSIGVAVAVNVLLNFLLISPFGIVGAAWATAAGFFCQFLCSWAWALASGPFWRDLRHAAKAILAAGGMAAGMGLVEPIVQGAAVFHLVAMIAIGVALYVALALLFGLAPAALTSPVRARLASAWRPR